LTLRTLLVEPYGGLKRHKLQLFLGKFNSSNDELKQSSIFELSFITLNLFSSNSLAINKNLLQLSLKGMKLLKQSSHNPSPAK